MSKTTHKEINEKIKDLKDTGCISDGYHTFGELYEHRITLFIALALFMVNHGHFDEKVWRSKLHSDGTEYKGWFILGINKAKGEQITYHLPMEKWHLTNFAETLDKAPEYDGHTSNDVLKRLTRI